MPRYGRIDPDKFQLQEVVPRFDVPIHRTTEPARILQATIGSDVPVYMVDNARYFDREGIYMYPMMPIVLSFSACHPRGPQAPGLAA